MAVSTTCGDGDGVYSSLPEPAVSCMFLVGSDPSLPQIELDKSAKLFAWHPSVDSLSPSALTCPLCQLVYQAYEQWMKRLDKAIEYLSSLPGWGDAKSMRPGKRLWLAKRFNGATPGLSVLLDGPTLYPKAFSLLAGIGFSSEKFSPNAKELGLPPLFDRDSGSTYNLEIVGSFLDTCINSHERCSVHEPVLPSRVVDVGDSSEKSLRLVVPGGQRGTYACLSYCWGGGLKVHTSRDNLAGMMEGFKLSDLPQTLIDAVKIARHLHIRYLWIDCLCICQDDPEDWARESASMADIYSNAYVVIAADHARNASEGCFHLRPEQSSSVVGIPGYADQVTISLLDNSSELDWQNGRLSSQPLSSRGWAYQERLLSPRAIHFASEQMYYECNHGIFGEHGCRIPDRYGAVFGTSGTPGEDETKMDKTQPWMDHDTWHYIVMEYTMRDLTKPTDRLPGLAGIAKLFKGQFDTAYVAGLWSDTLLRDLTWTPFPSTGYPESPVDCYTGPSWSWAGYAGVTPGPRQTQRTKTSYIAEIIEWQTRLKSQANPYGEVEDAWIRLRAPMAALIPEGEATQALAQERWPATPGGQQCAMLRTPYRKDDVEHSPVCWDYGAFLWKGLEIKVLLLEGGSEEEVVSSEDVADEDVDEENFFGLVVISTSGSNFETVKRVGYLELEKAEAKAMIEDEGNRCVVTLK